MVKSGLIFGAVSFVLVLGVALISPFCAPCLGLFLGLAAGYVAGVFDKPSSSSDSIRKGAIAGAIAGGLGLLGGLVGGAVNAAYVNPADIESLYQALGLNIPAVSQSQIWTYQLGFAFCIGLFNIVWMAILGVAGGAIWYQISGKNRTGTMMSPREPIQPGI